MTDREKVLSGLEHCSEDGCKGCPYEPDCKMCDGFSLLAKDAQELLKGKESEWLEDSDPGQEYGTTWACRKCMHSIHEQFIWNPYENGYKYCPHCGAEMKVKFDD